MPKNKKRFTIPCDFCGRPHTPQGFTSAGRNYCAVCSPERKAAAAKVFDIRPITEEERKQRYIVRERLVPRETP